MKQKMPAEKNRAAAHADVYPLFTQTLATSRTTDVDRSKPPGQQGICHGSPDGIRTRATTLREPEGDD